MEHTLVYETRRDESRDGIHVDQIAGSYACRAGRRRERLRITAQPSCHISDLFVRVIAERKLYHLWILKSPV